MSALLNVYLWTAGVFFAVVLIYQWGLRPFRERQLWGTALVLACVVEQMGNALERMYG